MARMQQVMVRLPLDKLDVLEEIGREMGAVIEKGPRAGEVNTGEVIRRLCAKADARMKIEGKS